MFTLVDTPRGRPAPSSPYWASWRLLCLIFFIICPATSKNENYLFREIKSPQGPMAQSHGKATRPAWAHFLPSSLLHLACSSRTPSEPGPVLGLPKEALSHPRLPSLQPQPLQPCALTAGDQHFHLPPRCSQTCLVTAASRNKCVWVRRKLVTKQRGRAASRRRPAGSVSAGWPGTGSLLQAGANPAEQSCPGMPSLASVPLSVVLKLGLDPTASVRGSPRPLSVTRTQPTFLLST